MSDDNPADELFEWVCRKYGLAPLIQFDGLLRACRERKVGVVWERSLKQWGCYFEAPARGIALHSDALPFHLGHEFVHLLADDKRRGDDSIPDLVGPGWTEETLCNAVAGRLCGPLPEGFPAYPPGLLARLKPRRRPRAVPVHEAPRTRPPVSPHQWFELELVGLVLDFGPEAMAMGECFLPHLVTLDDPREAAECIRQALEGPP